MSRRARTEESSQQVGTRRMDFIRQYYFDFGVMGDYFSPRPRRLLADAEALDRGRHPLADLGPGPGGAAAAAGQGAGAGALADDRLHRRLPRHSPADRPAARLGRAQLALRAGRRRRDPRLPRQADMARRDDPLLVRRDLAHDHLRRLHGRGLPGGDRGGPRRPDGSGPLDRHEPRQGNALRDRPSGRSQGDPAAAQRLHRADEGHLPGQHPRRSRGRLRRPSGPVRDLQRLRPDPGRDPLPRS